jgi:hypothetical protein
MQLLRLASLSVFVLLTACTTATEIGLPSGNQGYALNCSGGMWADCFKKAGEICNGRGYDILSRDESTGAVTVVNPQLGLATTRPTSEREMIVQCK